MNTGLIPRDPFFIPMDLSPDELSLPRQFELSDEPHPLCLLAAHDLQHYLSTQQEWKHNFGLADGEKGRVVGKMFGVLVVENQAQESGYLAAFSGKLAGVNHHARFVPPVFDTLAENGFVNDGMRELSNIISQISSLEQDGKEQHQAEIRQLKRIRKDHSSALQQKIFDHYHFLNKAGEEKSLNDIFRAASYKNPPSGAGECAAPKLLQYAFQHHYRPLALAEFWWGLSPKSEQWEHGNFYPCCQEKCHPIFGHMLAGINEGELINNP